jgi:queuine/archaeosine tRNA-ribosyltransferase
MRTAFASLLTAATEFYDSHEAFQEAVLASNPSLRKSLALHEPAEIAAMIATVTGSMVADLRARMFKRGYLFGGL